MLLFTLGMVVGAVILGGLLELGARFAPLQERRIIDRALRELDELEADSCC